MTKLSGRKDKQSLLDAFSTLWTVHKAMHMVHASEASQTADGLIAFLAKSALLQRFALHQSAHKAEKKVQTEVAAARDFEP